MSVNKKDMKKIDLTEKVSSINDIIEKIEFDFESENNLDIALSIGLLFSLNSYSKSKKIKKGKLKSMWILKQTNDVQKELIEALELYYIDENGKARKSWENIIIKISKSLSRNYEKPKWYNKILNR